jgi:hypothetical protein
MEPWMTVASALAALNVALLAVLAGVWLQNYRSVRTPLVLGLLAFAVVMLVENAAAIYFFLSMGMLYSGDPAAQQFVVLLRALEFLAVALLTYVTLQ